MKTEIQVQIKGISPLLVNRFLEKSIDKKSKKRSGAMQTDELKDKLYLHDEKPHIPSVYFRNAIVEAAKQFKVTGKGKSTFSKLAGSTVDVEPEMIKIIPGDYVPFKIAAVNPMTKGRMMVTRPRFNTWQCAFKVVLNDESLPPEVLNEILNYAGAYVGVGDWRPDKKGTFGKFMITSFHEV